MPTKAHPRYRGLHLVTAPTHKPKNPERPRPDAPQADDKNERHIAEGVLKFQTLQDEFNEQVFSDTPDLDRVLELMQETKVLGESLRAHGVQMELRVKR